MRWGFGWGVELLLMSEEEVFYMSWYKGSQTRVVVVVKDKERSCWN